MAIAEKFRSQWWQITLLAALIGIMGLFFAGLGRDVSFIPSPLIGRAAPQFVLPELGGKGEVTLAQFRGAPVIVNFWASWCAACSQEHDLLVQLGQRFADSNQVRLVGINYKDSESGALRFQAKRGAFPYPSAVDRNGRVGLDFGVYGLPETFFLDDTGKVIAKHVGPLTARLIAKNLAQLGLKQ